ncbi:LysR family transcriptional regulator [uncultured Tateyamaria sp.]|uniref:LysR family transcriptional regulator n=1 Tax=uncultured Tateyamaria sp. TaxID=455651 RepID=UPI00261B581D|nr:LysR family transcriptional regulator [uncultured Tateyamaria sp.]
MDRLQSLEVFVAVAEAGTFSGGARTLGISAPSATRGVNELEERLGARLFNRTTRVVRLTDVGRTYLDEVRGILADLDAANDGVSGAVGIPQGTLRLTSPVEFGRLHVAPILAEYLDLFPEVKASMLMVDRVVNLVEEGLDLGVRIGPLTAAGLMAVKVGRVRRVICGSPAYFAEHGLPQTPDDLAKHRIVEAPATTPSSEWRFGKKQDIVARVAPRLATTSVASAVALATSGWGLTRVLSYQVGPDLQSGSLKTVLEDYEPEHLPIHLVHYEGRRVSLKLRSFLDLAKERLRHAPSLN